MARCSHRNSRANLGTSKADLPGRVFRFDEGRPTGFRRQLNRQSTLGQAMTILLGKRCFTHLTNTALRSFLLSLQPGPTGARAWLHNPFSYRVIGPSRKGETRIDPENAATLVAWRLGVSCTVCRAYLGRKRWRPRRDETTDLGYRSSALAEVAGAICDACHHAEMLSTRAYRKAAGDLDSMPSVEYLLLAVLERSLVKKRNGRNKEWQT